jgi:hypothetical protein
MIVTIISGDAGKRKSSKTLEARHEISYLTLR